MQCTTGLAVSDKLCVISYCTWMFMMSSWWRRCHVFTTSGRRSSLVCSDIRLATRADVVRHWSISASATSSSSSGSVLVNLRDHIARYKTTPSIWFAQVEPVGVTTPQYLQQIGIYMYHPIFYGNLTLLTYVTDNTIYVRIQWTNYITTTV